MFSLLFGLLLIPPQPFAFGPFRLHFLSSVLHNLDGASKDLSGGSQPARFVYLRRVAAGESLRVTERGQTIAALIFRCAMTNPRWIGWSNKAG